MVQVRTIQKDTHFEVDLLAQLLGQSDDPKKNLIYQRIFDPDYDSGALVDFHPYNMGGLKEDGRTPKHQGNACGGEIESFFRKYMGGGYYIDNPPPYYALDTKNGDPTALKYDAEKLKNGIRQIKAFLRRGKPVRVSIIFTKFHSIPIKPQHYIGIVGYGIHDEFLYIDPAQGMSGSTEYNGYLGKHRSSFMGKLKYEKHPPVFKGPFSYRVIGGPL